MRKGHKDIPDAFMPLRAKSVLWYELLNLYPINIY